MTKIKEIEKCIEEQYPKTSKTKKKLKAVGISIKDKIKGR
jgi:hypothetical protein